MFFVIIKVFYYNTAVLDFIVFLINIDLYVLHCRSFLLLIFYYFESLWKRIKLSLKSFMGFYLIFYALRISFFKDYTGLWFLFFWGCLRSFLLFFLSLRVFYFYKWAVFFFENLFWIFFGKKFLGHAKIFFLFLFY